MIRRVILLIFDACGIGALPDAADYGDVGAATIPNIARQLGGLNLPNLQALGLGNIVSIKGVPPSKESHALFARMAEKSPGKDSTSGHWEIAGVTLDKPFPIYPNGFPKELIAEFEINAGVKTIGNIPASGTEIIKQLGERHMKTGEIILYTSADSVFQLAAHEDIIPLDRLYEICRIARDILTGEHAVGRVIARPFVGVPGSFVRTPNRHDFSLPPIGETVLDKISHEGIPVIGIGKIPDLFAGRGITRKVKAETNTGVISKVIDDIKITHYGLIFANLVDFDMLWGHRNDVESFGKGLEDADGLLTGVLARLTEDDLLIITADHGCDPTIKRSTDHTREYVPLLVYNKWMHRGRNLGCRDTFADIAATVADIFKIDYICPGRSFAYDIEQAMTDNE